MDPSSPALLQSKPTLSSLFTKRHQLSISNIGNKHDNNNNNSTIKDDDDDTNKNMKLFAMFGGQGYRYFDELKSIYQHALSPRSNAPDVEKDHFTVELISKSALALRQESSKQQELYPLHVKHVIDILQWFESSSSTPSYAYLHTAPTSYPLVALTQLASYTSTLHKLSITHEDMCDAWVGASGHSQGVVSAVIISTSQTTQDLLDNSIKYIRYLFYQGLRCSQAIPSSIFRLESELESDPSQQTPAKSPMLTVTGLDKSQLQKIILKTQAKLDEIARSVITAPSNNNNKKKGDKANDNINSNDQSLATANKMEISIINGPTNYVVSGYPKALSHLREAIQSVSNPVGESQFRVPHSSRKPETTTTFLRIGAAFHCSLNDDAIINQIEQDALRIFSLDDSEEEQSNNQNTSNYLDSIVFQFPVYSTIDGEEFLSSTKKSGDSFLRHLIKMQASQLMNFPSVLKNIQSSNVTHVFDFGPGGYNGIGGSASLTAQLCEGFGVYVVLCRPETLFSFSNNRSVNDLPICSLAYLIQSTESIPFGQNFKEMFSPRIVQRESDGKYFIDTKFTRELGKPPVMMAGMTPTTSFHGINLVAACTNGGFHGELGGGGLPLPDYFKEKVDELVSKLQPGTGITINMLYLNAYLWGFQFPLVLEMAKNGYPIESITIAAGVPTPDKARDILEGLASAGIKYIGLKPGTVTAIRECLEIARLNPKMKIMLQWTGGRGGGHHSYEDFHEPLLETYSEIRRLSNVILVVGSGFGDAEGSYPYLDGTWTKKFAPKFKDQYAHYPLMPVDGVLLGSRCMVATEAATAEEVKKLIVSSPGLQDESTWESSYKGDAGGVVTVISELGEPIHKVHTRGMALWREFDQKYFALPRGEARKKAILKDKKEIILRLNADFQKVYFPKNKYLQLGDTCDLEDMTYADVLRRMVELMYVKDGKNPRFAPNRWIDITYQTRTFRFMVRTERRFRRESTHPQVFASNVDSLSNEPPAFVEKFISTYPETDNVLLAASDVSFFVDLCQDLRYGKPVNFVPVIDELLDFWFKKDSLWCSEDLDAIPDRDAGRVCILQGPVAVRYSTKLNESICDILGNIHSGWIDLLQHQQSNQKNASSILSLMMSPRTTDITVLSPSVSTLRFSSLEKALQSLPFGWIHIACQSKSIIQKDRVLQNPMPVLLSSNHKSDSSEVVYELSFDDNSKPTSLRVLETETNRYAVEISLSSNSSSSSSTSSASYPIIKLKVAEYRPATPEEAADTIHLEMNFALRVEYPISHLHEILDGEMGTSQSILGFYKHIWLSKQSREIKESFDATKVHNGLVRISKEDIERFNVAIGNVNEDGTIPQVATLDIATMAGWEPLIKSIFADNIGGNFLKLVHLSHSYKMLSSTPIENDPRLSRRPIEADELIKSEVKVVGLETVQGGRKVKSVGKLIRSSSNDGIYDNPWVEITSEFLIRGDSKSHDGTFILQPYPTTIHTRIENEATIRVLESKSWFSMKSKDSVSTLKIGDDIYFEITTLSESYAGSKDKIIKEAHVSGVVKRAAVISHSGKKDSIEKEDGGYIDLGRGGKVEAEIIGNIEFHYNSKDKGVENDTLYENPVMSYLGRIKQPSEHMTVFEGGGYALIDKPIICTAPLESETYAVASRDLNPIHRNKYLARLAGLPNGSPIVHGMWTAAMARQVLEREVAKGDPSLIASYSVQFNGMVFPGDKLATQIRHIGVIGGRNLIEIDVRNVVSREKVLIGRAEIEQPKTAFLFTGQGSASVGMGMDRYNSVAKVKAVWDCADKHLLSLYGFSIIQIVRDNPTELTIQFGGPKGRIIRDNYRKIMIETHNEQTGEVEKKQLIPEIGSDTKSFTFRAPEGLLFATQFSQPALVLVQKAAFEELIIGGFVNDDSIFAGHSLGEYAALASFADVLTIEALVETVFLRGMVMQNAVSRDRYGRSDYGMVAANPSRVGAFFSSDDLFKLVDDIQTRSNGKLLQVVNNNVRNFQYVVAGDLTNLEALGILMNKIRDAKSLQAIPESAYDEAIQYCKKKKDEAARIGQPFTLSRTNATIPLVGIDVPFHSRQLLGGVPAFRQLLEPRLSLDLVSKVVGRLEGKYIPNVNAEPFSVRREYIVQVQEVTGSEALKSFLESHNDVESVPASIRARILLVELLAHQFAMPVQWIKTQDYFARCGIRRMIEMGPAPTLVGMAERSYASGMYGEEKPDILSWQRDFDKIMYIGTESPGPESDMDLFLDSLASSTSSTEAATSSAENAPKNAEKAIPQSAVTAVAPSPVVQQFIPPISSSSSSVAPSDSPVSAKHVLKVLLSQKFKIPVKDIADNANIKSLSGGKSAIQNEIVGEMSSEFGVAPPEGGAEMSISELSSKFTGYQQLGKVTSTAISKMLGGKLPGSFSGSAAKEYLSKERSLGPGLCDSIFVHALTMQPTSRLSSTEEAKAWIDNVIESYSAYSGVKFPAPGSGGMQSSSSSSAMMFMQQSMGSFQSSSSQPVPDAPVSAKHALQVLLAQKFKKSISDIPDTSSIKALSGGKSAIQNEIVGELNAEFGVAPPEGGAEMSISELSSKFTGYQQLGKVTSTAISKMLGGKLPGDFTPSDAKSFLAKERMLGSGRSDSVLLHALTMQPPGRLGNVEEAKAWLHSVVDSYSTYSGVSMPKAGSGGGSSLGGMINPMATAVSSEGLKDITSKLSRLFSSQIDIANDFLGYDPIRTHQKALESEISMRLESEAALNGIKSEMGESFIEGIKPVHNEMVVREYDSFWNWVIQDALEMHLHVLARVRIAKGESVSVIPNKDNSHFASMASWITAPLQGDKDGIASGSVTPPQAWFRNFLCNRATKELLVAVQHFAKEMDNKGQKEYAQVITLLAEQVAYFVNRPAVVVAHAVHDAPVIDIGKEGNLVYKEIPRPKVGDSALQYVEEMSCGLDFLSYIESFQSEVQHPAQGITLSSLDAPFNASEEEWNNDANAPRLLDEHGNLLENDDTSSLSKDAKADDENLPKGELLEVLRNTVDKKKVMGTTPRNGALNGKRKGSFHSISISKDIPLLHMKKPSVVDSTMRIYDEHLTAKYLSCLHDMASNGVSFAGQVALVTGAGIGSIAIEVVKLLLEGGATVITTINFTNSSDKVQTTFAYLRSLYEEFGSKGSKLIAEPCNCASHQDIQSLVSHIYNKLNLDLDFVVPFAAMPERGRDISNIDSGTELAHRMMLTNIVRLLGEIRKAKEGRNIRTRPAMVILPCSPNHGIFGNDGLYAESKLGIEALLDKWSSEGWEDYLSLVAAVIGWTRSSLMWQNNIVAQGVEEQGCRTFHPSEMGVNLVALLHPKMATLATEQPLYADLTGGWIKVKNIQELTTNLRKEILNKANLIKAMHEEETNRKMGLRKNTQLSAAQNWVKDIAQDGKKALAAPHKMITEFPNMPNSSRVADLSSKLQGCVNPRKVVVVVGFGEVGPFGSARTRWEMEAYGEFSLEGCIELAWITGMIRHHNGPLKSNPRQKHIGWVDAATSEPIHDHDIKKRYEPILLKHTGIRIIEPEIFEGYDPHGKGKTVMHSVAVERDMPPFEVSNENEGLAFKKDVGAEFCDVYYDNNTQRWLVKLKKGAVIMVPKAMNFNRFVAGQIPLGWDAKRLGVPDDIANSVDPVTLYALVSTVEALVSAGITDPYELYEYVHVTEVGNTLGGGMGGMRSLKRMFEERKLGTDIPSDTLAESFINTMPAYINMLLLSSSGPIKTPVGACATAAESIDIGVETILSGKARMVVAGGFDDFGEVGSNEFAMMGATIDNETDLKRGRMPSESSRPMSSTRNGFVEAHGAGVQILMDAELAIELGCPIYGVVALSNTATDKMGRSVPAPGQGILTTAREVANATSNPMLNVAYRRKLIQEEMTDLEDWLQTQHDKLATEVSQIANNNNNSNSESANASSSLKPPTLLRNTSLTLTSPTAPEDPMLVALREGQERIQRLYNKKKKAIYDVYGEGFYMNDSTISPLRGALSVWGLTIDDLPVASFHGTSTSLNDTNESKTVNQQMEHLGRSPGNILLCIAQKNLTGHPKGAAAAWMLNGLLQCMRDSIVPGNRNLDNVDEKLRKNSYLHYPNRSKQLPVIECALLKSFGFGQAGAEILLVHPDRFLATLDAATLDAYKEKRAKRNFSSYRYMQKVFTETSKLVQVKNKPPYSNEQQSWVLLDPTARAEYIPAESTWGFVSRSSGSGLYNPSSQEQLSQSTPNETVHPSVAPKRQGSSKGIVPASTRLKVTMTENAWGLNSSVRKSSGVGVDIEPVSTFKNPTQSFIENNFTSSEIDYCQRAHDPAASFAGRWAAKEAVIKALSNANTGRPLFEGAHAPLNGIEVVQGTSGAPVIVLHGHVKEVAQTLGITEIKVSISHSDEVAVAQALALQ